MSVHSKIFACLLVANVLCLNSAPGQAETSEAPAQNGRVAFVFPRVILNNDNTGWDALFLHSQNPPGSIAQINQAVRNASQKYIALGDLPSVDAQSLSVNYSTFPAWRKSSIYTFEDHDRFLRTLPYYSDPAPKTNGYPGQTPSSARTYITSGNDFIEDFLNQGRQGATSGLPNQLKILSFRLNDHHYTWNYPLYSTRTKRAVLSEAANNVDPLCQRGAKGAANVDANEHWAQMSFTGIFSALKTGVLDPQLDGRCIHGNCLSAREIKSQCGSGQGCVISKPSGEGKCDFITLNFSAAAVRNFKIMQMAEIVQNYQPPALEIDIDRFPQYFDPGVSKAQRISTMTAFLQQTRSTLLRIEPNLRIGLRVPSKQLHRENVGVDLPAIDKQQLADYIILAMPAAADQQIQYQIDPSKAHAKIYAEMFEAINNFPQSQASFNGFDGLWAAGYSPSAEMYPADTRALATATHLANTHHRVQGMAIFNSQYYQYHMVNAARTKRASPPESGIECLGNPANAAQNDQHYFLTHTHYGLQQVCMPGNTSESVCDQLPFSKSALIPGHSFQMEMAAPAKGWKPGAGLLRLTFFAYPLPKAKSASALTTEDYAKIASGLRVAINGKNLILAPSDATVPLDPVDGPIANAYYKSMWWTAPVFNKLFQIDASVLINGQNNVAVTYSPAPNAQALNFRVVNFEMFLPANSTGATTAGTGSCAALAGAAP